MSAISTIYKREMRAYVRSMMGWLVAAMFLLISGLLFYAFAMDKALLSADVLRTFFYFSSGTTIATAILLSFRTFAEERQNHSLVLLTTSPASDAAIVAGKFLAAVSFLAVVLGLSVYIPLLIKVNGSVSGAQIFVGYLGLWLLGSAVTAIGLFASALTRHQLVAALIATAISISLVLLYMVSKQTNAPIAGVLAEMDLWWIHFQQGFMVGILNLKDVVFYLTVTYFFLLAATKTVEAKRWQ